MLDHSQDEKMVYTTKRFDPKSDWLYRGYFPVIPNKKDHKEAWEIGQWDTPLEEHLEKYKDDFISKFIKAPGLAQFQSQILIIFFWNLSILLQTDFSFFLRYHIRSHEKFLSQRQKTQFDLNLIWKSSFFLIAPWPNFKNEQAENTNFRKVIRNAFNVYYSTAMILLELICIGLKLDFGEFEKILKDSASTFRMLHYPPRHDTIPEDCILPNGGQFLQLKKFYNKQFVNPRNHQRKGSSRLVYPHFIIEFQLSRSAR